MVPLTVYEFSQVSGWKRRSLPVSLLDPVNKTMIRHNQIKAPELRKQIRNRVIIFGGNAKLKIYGKLSCKSGKRMKKENRVFFISEKEAIHLGYRPCGHCLKKDYQNWKLKSIPSG
ncbi:hypothetical protein LPTSP3_g33220 [Leptospira kobayashii]|uniref:Ada DNA repair metal-binding domain-containing protein n=1 Tax=Leptospira kobayashii TaxID=1917830 RepID=A0ABN6KGR1_9LEPT|nr:Ada metal-binding domain-containing protein [Leptospira kobayashii]BDA80392.1 hypothetical protein LPTSP3_g33220 [Leptospira kobayashii]